MDRRTLVQSIFCLSAFAPFPSEATQRPLQEFSRRRFDAGVGVALSGDRLRFGEQEIVLADTLAPCRMPFRFDTSCMESQRFLQEWLASAPSIVFPVDLDRWGRTIGYVSRPTFRSQKGQLPKNDASLLAQADLVKRGLAIVYPQSEENELIEFLLKVEQDARVDRLGLWRDVLKVFSADKPDIIPIGTICLVEGRINSIGNGGSRRFLNFGTDYKQDFTVTVRSGEWRRWKMAARSDVLVQRKVRVRGIVQSINGPSIELKHSLQLELLA